MLSLGEKNYLTLIFFRGGLVEKLIPEDFINDFDFLTESDKAKLFHSDFSRPEKVRNLLNHLALHTNDEIVEKFINLMETKAASCLPENTREVLDNPDIRYLRKPTFYLTSIFRTMYPYQINQPPNSYIERPELCKKLIHWLQRPNFNVNELTGTTDPLFLFLYGPKECGKTYVCTEIFRHIELQSIFPASDAVMKISLDFVEDMNEIKNDIFDRIKTSATDPNDELFHKDNKLSIDEKINILMSDRQRFAVPRIILMLDNYRDKEKHNLKKEDFVKHLSYKNFLILIISHHKELGDGFSPEDTFDMSPYAKLTDEDIIRFSKHHLGVVPEDFDDDEKIVIDNLLTLHKRYEVGFLIQLFKCINDDRKDFKKRLEYYINVSEDELELLIERIVAIYPSL